MREEGVMNDFYKADNFVPLKFEICSDWFRLLFLFEQAEFWVIPLDEVEVYLAFLAEPLFDYDFASRLMLEADSS